MLLEAAIEGAGRGNKGRKKTDKASSCIANRAASGVFQGRARTANSLAGLYYGVYGAVER